MKEEQPVWKRKPDFQLFCRSKEIISIYFYYKSLENHAICAIIKDELLEHSAKVFVLSRNY